MRKYFLALINSSTSDLDVIIVEVDEKKKHTSFHFQNQQQMVNGEKQ
jgi:hypothetical protein